ncbi:MAG: antitoxin Xre/MbcA/ParS toxin-binding domain-containing protein [Gemmatimonadota bacterium]
MTERDFNSCRTERRLRLLLHLRGMLGDEVVSSLGASTGEGLEVLRRFVGKGAPSRAVEGLQKELAAFGVPRPSQYVEVVASRATRARRDTLTAEEGERLVRIAGTMARALDVWEDRDDAAAFLNTRHPMLDHETPMDRARSEMGARQVDDLLTKLDLGLPV